MDRPLLLARATSHVFKSGGVRKMVCGGFDTFMGLSPSDFVCHIGIRYSDCPLSQIDCRKSSGEIMGRPPSPDKERFIVRLPDGMRDQIREAAQANNRTMTAEIVARLRWSFEAGQNAVPASLPEASGVEQRLRLIEQDHVSRKEFADFKLTVEATYRRE